MWTTNQFSEDWGILGHVGDATLPKICQIAIPMAHPRFCLRSATVWHPTSDCFLHAALRIELEKVDPRVNPNLLLEETSQEFWDNMSRKPYAKAILKSERHWSKRRTLAQDQMDQRHH